MSEKIYPDLQIICRLCLKENEGTVCIFPEEKSSDKYSTLSIPMRIMACTSLEIQNSNDFPKKICSDCRLQLEKFYYFRKRSQVSDAKLKKHLRMVSMGKISKVFAKQLDDDDEDELEFKDSLEFIHEQEEQKQREKDRKFEQAVDEIRLQYEHQFETTKEELRIKYEEELVPLMKEEIKKDLRVEVKKELEESLRQTMMEQCLIEAKELVRAEVLEECRQSEVKSLLNDLQTFLINKKNSLEESPTKTTNIRIIKPKKRETQAVKTDSGDEYLEMELQSQNEVGATLKQIVTEDELNINNDEYDNDGNMFTYDTDEGFEVQKKNDNDEGHHVSNDANVMEYEDEEMENNFNVSEFLDHNEESQDAPTTSYTIDHESGEIQFLKNSEDFKNEISENNVEKSIYENIMIIKLPENMESDLVEEIEEAKYSKPKKQLSVRPEKSPEKNSKSIISTSVARTRTTVEATVLTKSYVNPSQRCTDTPKIFKCNDCPMVFSTKHSLERHLKTHKKVERLGVNFQCPECRIVVSCSSALRRHMYTHYEKKPFPCNLCDKSFVQKEILKRHLLSHTGAKPHQCPHCERAFAQRMNLNQHINNHHLKEPRILQHSCHFCPKRFNHASGLSRHLASHSGVAFQCSECDRTFGDRSSIKRHIASMHTNAKASKSLNK